MAVLHGSWLSQNQGNSFFIWGETWRRISGTGFAQSGNILSHPLAMSQVELSTFLASLQKSETFSWQLPENGKSQLKSPKVITNSSLTQWQSVAIAIPTIITNADELIPQHSAAELTENDDFYLYTWQVEGISLAPSEAINFLQSIPLGTITENSFVGADLRFWSHLVRWSLDLLARCKFLPALIVKDLTVANWQILLDSAVDQNRFERFTKLMPSICQTYQEISQTSEKISHLKVDLPANPQELLRNFLSHVIDTRVRKVVSENPLDPKIATSVPPQVKEWLQGLGSTSGIVKAIAPVAIKSLATALTTWTAPLQQYLDTQNRFRAGFYLQSPLPGKTEWMVEYVLQSIADSEFLIAAQTIWNNPGEQLMIRGIIVEQPQETLLKGLGLATRLFTPIESSLDQPCPTCCVLTPIQAYEFIKTAAWRFLDSGLGVILPSSLTNRDAIASRLGLSIRAETPKLKKNDRLGLQSLLNFQWELSIGGQKISKAEFDRLVALNSPLVEINGEWVELRSQDVRAAQNFFTSRKEQLSLSLEDALRLSTGDNQMIEKLPVVSFESSGMLQELMSTLTGNQQLEEITPPANFRGELRPYQARGVSWLAFLQRWSLGACLADDMGLGKTIQLIAFLLYLREKGELEAPVLLICPTSVLGNWEREVKKFSPTLKLMVHHGDKRAKGKELIKAINGKDLLITSYPLIYRDLKDIQSISWQGIVLDEAQNIKNSDAKQSQAVRQINASFRIALTGTPVENRLSELWSILDFLNPGYLGPRNFFQRRFAIPIEKYGDTDSLQILRSLVRPFILRRLKSDKSIIQDLPEKQEMAVFCGLANEQAALYQKLVETSLTEIESSEGIKRRGMILALLVKLKQICNHPVLLKEEGKSKQTSISTKDSGKLQRLEEMLEEVLAEGDRALIFTQFAEWGKLLKPYLEKQLKQEIFFLYGSTSKAQREEMIDRFQNDPQGPPIMILSQSWGNRTEFNSC